MSTHIGKIIAKMGYAESSSLKYGRDGFIETTLSAHYKKVLNSLAPHAVYIVDNAPFVLFYEETADKEKQEERNEKIWNAQIPITIVCGTDSVRVYNSYSIIRKNSTFKEIERLSVDEIDESSPFSYWEITSQNFWVTYTKQFSEKKLSDHLLRNLSDITKKLRDDYKVDFATKLTLRLIFIRYLIDRGVKLGYTGFNFDVDDSRKNFLNLLTDKAELYKLFRHLKGKFNGNLFEELNNEVDTPNLNTSTLQILHDFFSANHDTQTGQMSLFDLYDFNIIPVELISNIYEMLLGKEKQNKDNAFYTPQYLVDYILDGSVSTFIRDNGACKVLDPSCGSGIFLVETYRRMVEKELDGKPFSEDDELLKSILMENIYGVDLNEDAIDVAIFSLYLAILDYKNPKTLEKFTLPNLKGEKLFVADFFDENALRVLKNVQFNFIIGNPPWGKGGEAQKAYYKKHKLKEYNYKDDTCRAFILRSKDFCYEYTQCCFVLHSKMLYMQDMKDMQRNPSRKFREFLLKNTKISKVIELSSVRELVFKNADAPAVILAYSFSEGINLENRFEYISMKPNLFFELFNIFIIEKTDIKYVPQGLLVKNDWAWKTLVYGFSGDIDVIERLKQTTRTLEEGIKSQQPDILNRTGVQYHDGNLNDASHLLGRPLLDSETSIDHFVLYENNTSTFAKKEIHRPRNKSLFHAPYCLVKKGLDMTDYTMRAVYSEIDFVFHEAVYAIKGEFSQKTFLESVAGILNSKLYAYFNLMLGSSLGVEREQRFMSEVLNFPFIAHENIAKQVELIQQQSKHEFLTVAPDVSGEIEKLNKMILEAFGLADNPFVDYALSVQIPWLTDIENCIAFQAVNHQQLKAYIKPFLETLSAVFGMSDRFVSANIYPAVTKYYSAIEIILHDSKPAVEVQVIDEAASVHATLTRFSAHKVNDMFFTVKDVMHFEENSFYIIKANYYKNWHPAIAENDLAEVIGQILSEGEGMTNE